MNWTLTKLVGPQGTKMSCNSRIAIVQDKIDIVLVFEM
jgi:hypothetical protein